MLQRVACNWWGQQAPGRCCRWFTELCVTVQVQIWYTICGPLYRSAICLSCCLLHLINPPVSVLKFLHAFITLQLLSAKSANAAGTALKKNLPRRTWLLLPRECWSSQCELGPCRRIFTAMLISSLAKVTQEIIRFFCITAQYFHTHVGANHILYTLNHWVGHSLLRSPSKQLWSWKPVS